MSILVILPTIPYVQLVLIDITRLTFWGYVKSRFAGFGRAKRTAYAPVKWVRQHRARVQHPFRRKGWRE